MNVRATWDFTEIYNIHFQFTKSKYSVNCETIVSFDTETSNGIRLPDSTVIAFDHEKFNSSDVYRDLVKNGEKVSLLYLWQCAVENDDEIVVFLGRSYEDYLQFIHMLTLEVLRQSARGFKSVNRDVENLVALKNKKYVKMLTYVHNFAFDFQHLRNIFNEEFSKHSGKLNRCVTFAREARKVMKTMITLNYVKVEYRDSYVLTQKSLKNWCKDANLCVKKLEEPADFYLEIRTPKTQLLESEIQYGVNDVASMVLGIQQYRDKCGGLHNISLTQTGEVRKKCVLEVAKKNESWNNLSYEIQKSYDFEFFKKLCKLFGGGWTHANARYVNKLLKNIRCFDFASSYPAVMTTRTYPVSQFQERFPADFQKVLSDDVNTAKTRWFARIKFHDVVSKLDNTYFSASKALNQLFGEVVDNGRIKMCEELDCYLTDLDYDTFVKAYNFTDYEVVELYEAKADYLAAELIDLILNYFKYKTSLKGVDGAESLYAESKQFINSIYGCSVTKIVTDEIDFAENWTSEACNEKIFFETMSQIKKETQFLPYQVGIWVTSWARHNLWDFIVKFDKKIAYCDTDSIKGFFDNDDLQWIEDYNKNIEKIENDVAAKLNIEPNLFCPLTKTGKKKRLGIMEREEDCDEFKTLGAKRYCVRHGEKLELTVAGLPKSGVKKLNCVEDFTNHTVWNTRESGKNVVYYNDNQNFTKWIDRDGNTFISDDKFGACILPTSFDLNCDEFLNFVNNETEYNTIPDCLL